MYLTRLAILHTAMFLQRWLVKSLSFLFSLFSISCPQAKAQKGKLVPPSTTSATTATTANVSVTTATASTVTAPSAASTEATVQTRFSTRLHGIYDDDDEEDMTDLQPTFTGPIIKYDQTSFVLVNAGAPYRQLLGNVDLSLDC